jgi:hypothetical protein
MPRLSEAAQFDRTISQLITKRRTYTEGLAQIDAILAKYNIQIGSGSTPAAAPARNRTTAAKSPAATRARRGRPSRFAQTGGEFVLSFIQSKNNPVTADIAAAWNQSGRKGKVHNTLGKLVKEKRIKRTPVKDGRGSSYAVA